MKFADTLSGIMVTGAVVCPHCKGTGLSNVLTTYTNSGRTCVLKCDICLGTGIAHNTYQPDIKRIKEQMFLARYFHSQDPTQVHC